MHLNLELGEARPVGWVVAVAGEADSLQGEPRAVSVRRPWRGVPVTDAIHENMRDAVCGGSVHLVQFDIIVRVVELATKRTEHRSIREEAGFVEKRAARDRV